MTKRHYEDLTKGSTPFVCQWCNLKLARATIQQLQSEVASLKLELAEAKAAATTSKLQSSDSLAIHSYASAAAQPPRNQLDRSNSARGQRGAQRPRASQQRGAQRSRTANTAAPATSESASASAKVRVEGARRIWNTFIHATVKTVESAISRFCKVDGLKIKRKLRTNHRTGKPSWWFVVHGEETKLVELESKWDNLHTQASWVLQPCYKPAADDNESSSATAGDNSPSTNATPELEHHDQAVNSSESHVSNNNSESNQAIDGPSQEEHPGHGTDDDHK